MNTDDKAIELRGDAADRFFEAIDAALEIAKKRESVEEMLEVATYAGSFIEILSTGRHKRFPIGFAGNGEEDGQLEG